MLEKLDPMSEARNWIKATMVSLNNFWQEDKISPEVYTELNETLWFAWINTFEGKPMKKWKELLKKGKI